MQSFVQRHCTVATPGAAAFQRAAALSADPRLQLRAGDALHLAIVSSLNPCALLCLDDAMTASARRLGIEIVTL
jgi:hypothetical protein